MSETLCTYGAPATQLEARAAVDARMAELTGALDALHRGEPGALSAARQASAAMSEALLNEVMTLRAQGQLRHAAVDAHPLPPPDVPRPIYAIVEGAVAALVSAAQEVTLAASRPAIERNWQDFDTACCALVRVVAETVASHVVARSRSASDAGDGEGR